jgi:hypothetical protein
MGHSKKHPMDIPPQWRKLEVNPPPPLPLSDVLIHNFSPLPLMTADISSLGAGWIFSGTSQCKFTIFLHFTTLRLIILQDEKIEQQYSSRKGGKTNPNELYFVSKIVQTSTVRML